MKANLDSFGIISLTTSDDVLSDDAARDKVRKSQIMVIIDHMYICNIGIEGKNRVRWRGQYICTIFSNYAIQFFKAADEIWKPGITGGTFSDGDYVLKTNFLLISPIDKDYHKSVGKSTLKYANLTHFPL